MLHGMMQTAKAGVRIIATYAAVYFSSHYMTNKAVKHIDARLKESSESPAESGVHSELPPRITPGEIYPAVLSVWQRQRHNITDGWPGLIPPYRGVVEKSVIRNKH